jgi:glycosyltransferase involved in cell wall biosynthesis
MDMDTPSLSLIMPAYNEEKVLEDFYPEVVLFCKKNQFKLIVVDDGSRDRTPEILHRHAEPNHVTVLQNKLNGGYGAAIKMGIRFAQTDYVVTIDADGQHRLDDIKELFQLATSSNADMVVGSRSKGSGYYRSLGKWILHRIAKTLMPLPIRDINSGMKLYNTALAKKYISICPDTMAYSDIILLAFVYKRKLVIETPIVVKPRGAGKSTINTMTAIDTMKELINIVVLFNPMRLFFPIGLASILISLAWAVPFFLQHKGLSVGALLGIMTGTMVLFFGLIAEQISAFRKTILD